MLKKKKAKETLVVEHDEGTTPLIPIFRYPICGYTEIKHKKYYHSHQMTKIVCSLLFITNHKYLQFQIT